MKRLMILRIVVVLATLVLLVGLNPAAAGRYRSLDLSGSMSGFFVADGGDLPDLLFYVFESAVGVIDEGYENLGAPSFSYAGVFIYDMAVLPDPLPEECDPDMSSSSDYGHGTMFFGEGILRLEMKSAFSCFIFPDSGPPIIDINASYKIVGGTGLFKHARGLLNVTVDGTTGPPNTMTAQFEGKVHLVLDEVTMMTNDH